MTMLETVSNVTIDRNKARELLHAYRSAKAPATDEDRAIMTAYREIARGRVVIQAAQSIRDAGWNDDGSPKLAMTRADVVRCRCSPFSTGANFDDERGPRSRRANFRVDGMPRRPENSEWRYAATVPLIPLYLRPKAAISNYWILWEADWKRAPADPLLLRKLSGDLWLVLAWNGASRRKAGGILVKTAGEIEQR